MGDAVGSVAGWYVGSLVDYVAMFVGVVVGRIAYHKGCLITFHVPSHKTSLVKALKKIIYI